MNKKFEKLISLPDASKKFGRHESTLKTMISRGNFKEGIDCKKFGTTWVFDIDRLNEYYSNLEEKKSNK